jgi:hypothetical protein
MKRSVFLGIVALLSLIFGIALCIRSVHMMFMFDLGLDPSGVFMARMLGITMIALAATFWIGRKSPDSPAMSGILWGGLIQNLFFALFFFRMMHMAWMSSKAWGPVILHLLLALGFATYVFRKKPV